MSQHNSVSHHSAHFHHKMTSREKAIERHNPGHTAGYPFLGDYKVDAGVSHGHSPRPPASASHGSSLCMKISGSNVVIDEICIGTNESLNCSIGEIDVRHPLLPQTKNLSSFTFTGQRLSFPDNSKSYCLNSQVKNSRTHAVHSMNLVVCGSKDGQTSRPNTPRNQPREPLALPSTADYQQVRIRSDASLGMAVGVSANGNPPLLLPAGGSVDVSTRQAAGPGEILLLPPPDGSSPLKSAIDAFLASKTISMTSTTMPVGLSFNQAAPLMVMPGMVTKVSALEAISCRQLVLQTPTLPELDFSFALSGDGIHTVFSASISNFVDTSVAGKQSWRLCLSVPSNAALRTESTDGSAVLQFPATAAHEVAVAVWGPSAPLLLHKVRVPALKTDDESSRMASSDAPQVSVTVRDGNDAFNPKVRNVQVAGPPELSVSVSADGSTWHPGLPGINIADPLMNPVAHVSLLDRAASRKLAQLRIDLAGITGASSLAASSPWISELTAKLNSSAGLGDDAAAVGVTFQSLTAPTIAAEQGLLIALQGELLRMIAKAQSEAAKSGTGGFPRFFVSYAAPMSAAEPAGRFENVRCENAAQLAVQTGGPASLATPLYPGTSVPAPKSTDPHPTVIIATDAANKTLATLELRESAGSSGSDALRKKGAPELSFCFGAEPNTITGFFCSEPGSRVQVATSAGESNAQFGYPANADIRTVINLANGQRASIKAFDGATSAVLASTTVEGNRAPGGRNPIDIWPLLDAALMGCSDASAMRSMKPGSDSWLDELVRVVRVLGDPKRSFEIRFRGSRPGDAATVESTSLLLLHGTAAGGVRCTESEPVKVLLSDRVATVVAPPLPPTPPGSRISDGMMAAIENNTAALELLCAALTAALPDGVGDERIQRALLKSLNNFITEKNRREMLASSQLNGNKAAPIRFSLPRGVAMRNLKCDRNDAVLYATINGKRDRLASGETMPPAALSQHCDTLEIEAVVNSHDDEKRAVVSQLVCNFSTDSGSHQACVGFDCEVVPDGDEAIMHLTAPDGYQIVPRVDGLKGNVLGSRGLVRLDPCTSHVVQVTLQDPSGVPTVKQSLFLPRFALPRTDVFVDSRDGSVGVACPRGMKVVAAVDGGAERNTDSALQLDCDQPHQLALRFLGESLTREGGREMSRMGEVALKLPPIFAPQDVQELLRVLREHDPANVGALAVSRLAPRLSQIASGTKSNTVRDISTAIASIVDRNGNGGGFGGSGGINVSGEFFNRPPVAPVPVNRAATNTVILTNSQPTSRPNTPSIQFRLSGDQNAEDPEGGLE